MTYGRTEHTPSNAPWIIITQISINNHMNGKHNGWPIDSSNKYYTSKSAPCGRIPPSARWARIWFGAFSFIKFCLLLFFFIYFQKILFFFGKMQLFILLLVAMLLSFDLHSVLIDLLNKNNCHNCTSIWHHCGNQ